MTDERLSFRWGIPELDHGNVLIPESIYRFHGQLGVKANSFVLIVHLAAFKFESEGSIACPSFQTLADRMGISRRRVMEIIAGLEVDGWLEIKHRGTQTNEYNFQPFAKACWDLYKVATSAESRTSVEEQADAENLTSASAESRTPLVKDPAPEEQEEKNKKPKNKKPAPTARKDQTFPPEDYRTVEKAYTRITGIEPQGQEWAPIQQACKSMFIDGRTPEQIVALMEALEASDEEWTANWTIRTVRIKLAEHLAGHLDLSDNGDHPKHGARGREESAYKGVVRK